ncbi:5,6-dimethylbenzimidazole synthase [Rhodococcus rhodochrous]|uniref:5,6-dimethylbenzimidazole synthase n=1 Tax=Rhodococcus rhodochrous TaxID=1829 RepID=UPI0024BA1950|nr:5,6-dimethylbenzimidazole synthase [Rhodococcus rhodochrous]MDJ0399454.1 5,6-dimethylbenzimidazole synthase [Rhodococcus rhodochrous]
MFGTEARDALYDIIRMRRDVRAEFNGERLDEETLMRILRAAHHAPSVGNTQPWDFVVVQDEQRLKEFAEHVAGCRQAFADSLPEDRKSTFDPIKIEGIVESGTGVVVTYDPERGGKHILGRHTIDESGLFSAVLAIQNLWLAATAEGLGVGWVSFYEEDFLADFVGVSAPVRPIAWLCVGPVTRLQEIPDLERFGWRKGRPLEEAVHRDRFVAPGDREA